VTTGPGSLTGMAASPRRPAALNRHVFRGSEAVSRGLLTRGDLRSSAWVKIRHEVYADARLTLDHELACRAALVRLPAGTVVAGRSATFRHGVRHAATYADDVHVVAPASVRIGAQRGLRVHHVDLAPGETTGGDVPATSPARTVWDVARWLDPIEAVPIVDSLLGMHLVTRQTLADRVERGAGRRGCQRARLVAELADPGAQSPAESRLRVRLMLAGLPRPVTQCPVRIGPSLVLHPDLGWPQWRVAVEYDGHWHADAEQLHHDRRRLNQLVAAGWTVLHVTSLRLRADFPPSWPRSSPLCPPTAGGSTGPRHRHQECSGLRGRRDHDFLDVELIKGSRGRGAGGSGVGHS
jgi:hypothetical protein